MFDQRAKKKAIHMRIRERGILGTGTAYMKAPRPDSLTCLSSKSPWGWKSGNK